jgi:hypothetical protein
MGQQQRAGDQVAGHHAAIAEPAAAELLGDDRHAEVIHARAIVVE